MDGEFSPLNDNIVYFNSADFNGHQFLTDDAMKAGYVSRTFKPDASVVEKGIASLVEQDIASLIVSAEDSLLRILVKRRSARTTVMNMLEARSAVSYGDEIHFSCPAKEWLFDRLVRNATTLPEETKQSSNLRSFLAQQVDVPFLAFLEVATSREGQNVTRLSAASNNGVGILAPETALEQSDLISALNKPSTESFSNTLNPGSLERYFADDLVSDDVTSDDVIVGDRADLAVQEIIVTLLWASAALKSKLIRQKLSASIAEQQSTRPRRDPATSALKRTKVADEESESMRAENANHSTNMQYIHDRNCSPRDTPELLIALNHTNLSTAESDDEKLTSELHLVTYQKELLTKLRDTARTLQSLKESAKRVNARLMDESSSTGIEGHMSAALQADLASRLDDHVRDVCHARVSPDQELHFQAKNDEPYEDALERMAEEWGVWFDDEYVWSPDDSSKSEQNVFAGSVGSNSNEPDLIERETLAEFYERIEREWQGWDD